MQPGSTSEHLEAPLVSFCAVKDRPIERNLDQVVVTDWKDEPLISRDCPLDLEGRAEYTRQGYEERAGGTIFDLKVNLPTDPSRHDLKNIAKGHR